MSGMPLTPQLRQKRRSTTWTRINYGACYRCSLAAEWLRIKRKARGSIELRTYCDRHAQALPGGPREARRTPV
jgi:hypothetical protein